MRIDKENRYKAGRTDTLEDENRCNKEKTTADTQAFAHALSPGEAQKGQACIGFGRPRTLWKACTNCE